MTSDRDDLTDRMIDAIIALVRIMADHAKIAEEYYPRKNVKKAFDLIDDLKRQREQQLLDSNNAE